MREPASVRQEQAGVRLSLQTYACTRTLWDVRSFYGTLDDAKVGRDAALQTWKRVFTEESDLDEREAQARETARHPT